MKKNVLNVAFFSALWFAATSSAQAMPLQYRLTDLGSLGGSYSDGIAISAGGVTGSSNVSGNTAVHAFQYSVSTGMVDVGTLGGRISFGHGISQSGFVTGNSEIDGSGIQHAFLYTGPGSILDLGTLGGSFSVGMGVNDAGQVTGDSLMAGDRRSRAFLYSGGTMHDLGTLGGTDSVGSAINNNGQVTGSAAVTGNGAMRAFLYDGGTMTDLGTLAGRTSSQGWAINSLGDVAGVAWGGDTKRAFLYSAGAMRDLGTLGGSDSEATGVNDQGVVTGWSYVDNTTTRAAFVYADGQMHNLQDLVDRSGAGWTFTSAMGINNAGQITGEGSVNGIYHGYLLTPVDVPEPGSVPVVALGLAVIATLRRTAATKRRS